MGDSDVLSMPDMPAPGIVVGRISAVRTKPSTSTIAAAFLSLFLIPSLGSATIYKCTAEGGSITYTDTPCPSDTTTQYINPSAPQQLADYSQMFDYSAAVPDGKYESQPEILAILCANDEFKVWLKAQRHGLPERDVRAAKYNRLSILCRRALHLPDVAPTISQTTTKSVLGQEVPRPVLTRNQ